MGVYLSFSIPTTPNCWSAAKGVSIRSTETPHDRNRKLLVSARRRLQRTRPPKAGLSFSSPSLRLTLEGAEPGPSKGRRDGIKEKENQLTMIPLLLQESRLKYV